MRFVVVFLLTVSSALALIAGINYVVNPYALYPTHFFTPASANDLDRSLQDLENPQLQPELVVFGSSRSARMLPQDLQCYSGLASANQAYAGATPEGYFALASYLVANKPPPKLFILGVDVEAFDRSAKFADKISNVPKLQHYLGQEHVLQALWLDATQLISFAQLSDSIGVMARAAGVPDTEVSPLDRAWRAWVNRFAARSGKTGTQAQAEAATAPTPFLSKPVLVVANQNLYNRSEQTPAETIAHNLNRYDGYTELAPEQQHYLEALLQLARDRHIRVKLFITTMHPQLVAALDTQGFYPRRYAELTTWFNMLKQQYPFEYHDFSTPDKFGGTLTDFFNLAHIDETNSARLIAALFQDTPHPLNCAPNKP